MPAQLILEFAITLGRLTASTSARVLGPLARRKRLQPFAQDQFDRPGLAGEFREAQHPRLLDAPASHQKHCNRIFLRGSLENDGVEVVKASREFGQAAQGFGGFIDTAMDRGGPLKIERFASCLAFASVFRRERCAACR